MKKEKKKHLPQKPKRPTEQQESVEEASIPEVSHESIATRQMTLRFGPIPDPETLAQYHQIDPAIAISIIQQFEKQSEHRQQMERKSSNYRIWQLLVPSIVILTIAYFAYEIIISGNTASGITIYIGIGATWLMSTLWSIVKSSKTSSTDE